MVEGKNYYYLSVPRNAEWIEIEVSKTPKQYDSNCNWNDCVAVEESDTLGLYALNQLIRELKISISTYYDLTSSKGWNPSGKDRAWWVSVSKPSDVKSITIQSSSDGITPNKSNCFKTEDEAKMLRTVIRGIFAKYGIKTKDN